MNSTPGRERPAPASVSAWELAAFASPAAPLLALTLPTIMFLPPHFAEHLGLPLAAVSAIFFLTRIFDIVIDPMLGAYQDRTSTRWGRRRPWILASCIPLVLFVWVVFLGLPQGVSVWVAGAAVMAMYFFFAVMMVAHLGWAGEILPTYHGRTKALGAVQAFGLIGQALMLFIAGYVVQGLGGDNGDAIAAMGWTLAVLFPLTALWAVFGAREEQVPPQPHLTLGAGIQTLFKNASARRVLLPDLLLGISQGVAGGLFLFYFQFVLGFRQEAQTLAAIYFITGLIGVPIWWGAGRAIGKHRALQAALLYTAVTTGCLLFISEGVSFALAAALMGLAGLAQGGCVLLTRALMADVVDEDEVMTGSRRSGLYLGLLLTTSKFGLIAGPVALAVLQIVGFIPQPGAANPPAAVSALAGMFIGVPIVACTLAALSLRNYPLDEKRQAELAAQIAARHAQD
jgi:Na+/melibiose symporter-like transporter